MSRYVFDLETNGLLPDVNTIHCAVLLNIDTEEMHSFGPDEIPKALALLASADLLIGHNIQGYDIPVIKHLHPAWTTNAQIRDTLIISRLIWTDIMRRDSTLRRKHGEDRIPKSCFGRHKLEAWGARLGEAKGDFGKTTDWSEWSPEMQQYCEQDVRVNFKLWQLIVSKQYSDEAIDLEHDFCVITALQESFGFCFDDAAGCVFYTKLAGKRREVNDKLQEIFPPTVVTMKTVEYYTVDAEFPEFQGKRFTTKTAANRACRTVARREGFTIKEMSSRIKPGPLRIKRTPFNPGSDLQIHQRLATKYNWEPKVWNNDGSAKVDEKTLKTLPFPEVKDLLEYKLVDKRISQLAEGKEAWLKKVKPDGRIYGRVNHMGCVTGRCSHSSPNIAQVPKVGSPYGEECRSLFSPPEGWVLVGCDASGLELRCLGHYVARYDDGAYVKIILEGDVHTANQEAAGLPTRDKAKTFIYAWLYGAGDELLGSFVDGGRKDGRKLRNRFLKKMPAIKFLLDAVKLTVKRGYVIGLDGRHIHIRSAHAALNSLLQSAGALVMKRAAVILHTKFEANGFIHGRDYGYCANIHDEFQIACHPSKADILGQLAVDAIREAGVSFNFRCPLDAEYKVGKSWAETH